MEGIYFYRPSAKAPEFIKFNISIERDRLIDWLKKQDEKVRVVLKESKQGNLYVSIDDYKPESEPTGNAPDKETEDDLPF